MDGGGSLRGARAVPAARNLLSLPDPGVHRLRLQLLLRRAELQHRTAARVQDFGGVGRPRRLDAPVGHRPRGLGIRGGDVQHLASRGLPGARAGGDGAGQRRVPSLPPAHVQPVRASASRTARGARPQPAAPGPGHGRASAAALHGLRRSRGAVRLRGRRPDRRPHRSRVDALDPALDGRRLGIPHRRHHARELVGVQRARLGRLVVLGPRRERLVHAVARRDRADSFPRGDGAARRIPRVDAAPRPLRVLA